MLKFMNGIRRNKVYKQVKIVLEVLGLLIVPIELFQVISQIL